MTTMGYLAKQFEIFLEFNDREILQDSRKITAKIAKEHAFLEIIKSKFLQL